MQNDNEKEFKIVVAGVGYVGLTISVCLANKGFNVICVDIDKNKIERLKNGQCVIFESGISELLNSAIQNETISFTCDYESAYRIADVILVCVPTPEDKNGNLNLKYLNIVMEQIAFNMKEDAYIVIKSTIPVGTCEEIQKKFGIKNIVFNPEFLSQGEAVKNFMEPQRIVIGVNDEEAQRLMERIYDKFECPKLFMDLRTAELSKYASNNFLAVKITFINEISNLCDKLNINVEDIISVMKLDKRIGELYMEPGIGYGGSCLPKDTNALLSLGKDVGVDLNLIEATIKSNKKQRVLLIEKLDEYYPNKENLNVAILGLSFKDNTNDLRESQAIECIEKIYKNVKRVVAFDNKINTVEECKILFADKENVIISNNIETALKDADVCMIFNKEKEILELSPECFVKNMKNPVILDGRNCFSLELMNYQNIKYSSIGRNVNLKI